jgi:CDP-diacylglycerol---serine O-phosphatidyltransferase
MTAASDAEPTWQERSIGRVRPAEEDAVRHLSLIRSFHLADFLTLANGACGTAAILYVIAADPLQRRAALLVASGLIVLALVFDFFDGRVARWRQRHSAFGRELDSLADIISFGVAPAAIVFAGGLDSGLDAAVLVFFTLCGLSRLARYNVTAEELSGPAGKVAYFEGTPIPTSVLPLLIAVTLLLFDLSWPVRIGGATLHLPVLLFAVSGVLMVSKTLHIPKP